MAAFGQEPTRTEWRIGNNAPAGTSGESRFAEFSPQNNLNDRAPGAVTRLPADPQFQASANPGADDDYYFSGVYPAGFNGLTAPLTVPFDEPFIAWERAHTLGDRTNRLHFQLTQTQALGTGQMTLRVEWATGGFAVNGVTLSGFSDHDMVIQFRNGLGIVTTLFSGRISSVQEQVLAFTPSQVQATTGANSIQIHRIGPALAGYSYWITYDYLQLNAPVGNTAPVPPTIRPQTVPERAPLALNLSGPIVSRPGTLAYSFGDSITAGAQATTPSINAWHPLVAAARGWALTNLAYSSSTISDINWQILPGFLRTNSQFHAGTPVRSPDVITTNLVSLLLTGYNDGRDGFGRTNQTAYQAFYRSGLRHAATYLAIPSSGRTVAQAANFSGHWIRSDLFGGNMGLTCSDDDGTLTFEGLSGPAIYVAYMATAFTDLGSFLLSVDGQPPVTVSCTGAFGNRNVRFGTSNSPIPGNVGTNGDGRIWASPQAIRIGGLQDVPHTVTIKPLSDDRPVTLLWAAGCRSGRAGLTPRDGPSVWVGGTLRSTETGYLSGDDAGMARFTQIQAELCAELSGDGLPVQHVRAGDYFDPDTGMSFDFVHPNNLGHAQIATAFLDKLVDPGSDQETPPSLLSYSLLSGPEGMSLTPDGRLNWTPTEAQGPSTQVVRIRVTDQGTPPLSATNEFTVVVTEQNSAPVSPALADVVVDEGSLVDITLPAVDADLPPQSLSFQMIAGPAGAQLSPEGRFTWRPTEEQGPATYPVSIRITDNGARPLSTTNAFNIRVSEVNTPPIVAAVPTLRAMPGFPLAFSLSASDTDLPSNLIRFERVSGPDGLSVSESGRIDWNPTLEQCGAAFPVLVRVLDSGVPSQSSTIEFLAVASLSPLPPVVTQLGEVTVPEGSTFSLAVPATDPGFPARPLLFELIQGPPGMTLTQGGLLTWPTSEEHGPTSRSVAIRITSDGPVPVVVTNVFSLTVLEVNRAPTTSELPPLVVDEGSPQVISVPVDDHDDPSHLLTFELVQGPPGSRITSEGDVLWTPSEDQGPSEQFFSIRISDNGNPSLSATNQFVVTVREINLPPTILPVPEQSAIQTTVFSLQLEAQDPDLPLNRLTFSRSAGPAGLAVSESGRVTWTPTVDDAPGEYPVTVSVSDNGVPSLSGSRSFVIRVTGTNQRPALAMVPDAVGDELALLTLQLSASDADLPAQSLTYSLVNGPEGMTISPTGVLNWTPTEAQGPGTYPVSVKVTDNGIPSLEDTRTFAVRVNESNVAPDLAKPIDRTVDELSPLVLQLSGSDTDLPAQSLTYSLVAGPEGVTVSPTGSLSWTPTEAQGPGTYAVSVKVSDNGSPSREDNETFTVTVREVPDVVARNVWQIGVDDNPAVLPFNPSGEFSPENRSNDARPGRVTRLAGDPLFDANPALNPTADDDFYFQGTYPAGFNGLTAELRVPNDEPATAWERAHTQRDTTNRVHLILTADQVASGAEFRLSLEFSSGGFSLNGTTLSGFGTNDMVIRFRNSSGALTELFSQRLTARTNLILTFTAAQVQALAGANSLEIARLGPVVPGYSYWIQYDYLRLESIPKPNRTPDLAKPSNSTVEALTTLAFDLSATDPDQPAQSIVYALVGGPAGLRVSENGRVTWTPELAQSPGTYPVTVRATDTGTPPLSDTESFAITVTEPAGLTLRSLWEIGVDNEVSVLPYNPGGEFSAQNGRNDPRPGLVTRIAGDPEFDVNPSANPGADDDFYFKGDYPAGFNGLTSTRRVPNDEPASAWERALTLGDRTNRVHFVLGGAQTSPGARLRLSFEFPTGASSINGVTQPGFSEHQILVLLRNGLGTPAVVYSNLLTARTNIVLEFPADSVGATPGPNTLEFVRQGPAAPGVSYWIVFDYVRIQALPAPVSPTVTTFRSRIASTATARTLSEGIAPLPQNVLGTDSHVRIRVTVEGDDSYLELTYTRPEPPPTGVSYGVESSGNLTEWSPASVVPVETVESPGWRQVTVRDRKPLAASETRYLRVRVAPTDPTQPTE